MRRYTIVLEPNTEEGGYTVTVPALPGCVTQGEPFPEETEYPRAIVIEVAA